MKHSCLKKIIRTASSALLVFTMTAYGDTPVIKDRTPVAKIYHAPIGQDTDWPKYRDLNKLSVDEMDAKALAVSIIDLQEHLQKMSGAMVEIVVTDDPKQVQKPAIVVGTLANRMGAAPDKVGDDPSRDAFRVKAGDGLVLLGGASDYGASHAIYAMLEELGCDWVMPGEAGEVIPKRDTVAVPDGDIQEVPSFAIRNPYYGGNPTAEEWRELQMWGMRHKANIFGTKMRYGMTAGPHAWGAIIRKFKAEFEANPELYGLIRKPDGSLVRGGGQLESTNPRAIEMAIEYIRDTFQRNGWANDAVVSIGMGPNDGGALSLSPETVNAGVQRLTYDTGKLDGTDVCVLFINQILERTEKEFPNLHLGLMIYSWHADFPMRYKPHPRLVANIRDLNVSRFHSMEDETSRSRAYYRDVVQGWGALAREQGNFLAHGDYNWNPAEAVLPYTRVKISGDDFPIYSRAGYRIKSTNMTQGWHYSAAHDYVGIKLMWNAELNWRDLLREFCVKSYGPKAAPLMEGYYLELARRQSESSHEAGSFFAMPLLYDEAFVAAEEKRFDQALAAATEESHKRRIIDARYPLLTLKHFLAMHRYYTTFDFPGAKKEFEKATDTLTEVAGRNIHFSSKMGQGYFNRYGSWLDEAIRYSSGDYAMAYQIPNRLKTALDVNNLGAEHRFWGSKIDDSRFIETETFLSTWDAQGLSGFPQGSAWYRIHFKLPEQPEKPGGYGLFVGGAENHLAVWCNDKFIARSGAGLRSPKVFDLTDAIIPGGDNVLVIQTTRHNISELFLGGLTMPSFIFSGPRVPQAEDTSPLVRILPGGVEETIKEGEVAD